MKKGIEAWTDYDAAGNWRLNIEKRRGKLTLEEIKAAAREWEWDYYLLFLDCYHDEANDAQFTEMAPQGDFAQLYRAAMLNTNTDD